MRTILLVPLAALAACTAAADEVETSPADQAALTEALAGRTAGDPVACVRSQELRGNRSVGERMILFDGPGNTVYVNRTRSSCPRIQPWNALRWQSTQTAMCAGEIVRVFDPTTGVELGACGLGEFTPYRRN